MNFDGQSGNVTDGNALVELSSVKDQDEPISHQPLLYNVRISSAVRKGIRDGILKMVTRNAEVVTCGSLHVPTTMLRGSYQECESRTTTR